MTGFCASSIATVMTAARFITLASEWESGEDIASSTESPVYWLSHEHAQLSSSTPAVRRSSGVSLHASRKKKSGSSSTNAKTAAT